MEEFAKAMSCGSMKPPCHELTIVFEFYRSKFTELPKLPSFVRVFVVRWCFWYSHTLDDEAASRARQSRGSGMF